MQLLIVRHGKAGTREEFASTGLPDSQRPLTKEGRRKLKEAMPALRHRVPSIALLASSPLTRALDTAQIISEAYDGIPIMQRRELVPDSSPNVALPWLSEQTASPLVIVGHEPHLTELLNLLLSDASEKVTALKKGAMCLLEFKRQIAPKSGMLLWLKTCRQLAQER